MLADGKWRLEDGKLVYDDDKKHIISKGIIGDEIVLKDQALTYHKKGEEETSKNLATTQSNTKEEISDAEIIKIAEEEAMSTLSVYIKSFWPYRNVLGIEAEATTYKIGSSSIIERNDVLGTKVVEVDGTITARDKYGKYIDSGIFTVNVSVDEEGRPSCFVITDISVTLDKHNY